MYIAVIEKDNRIPDNLTNPRYIGAPCHSFDEARELVCAHLEHNNEIYVADLVENGVTYYELDHYTGEILKEFYVKMVS